MLFNVKGFNLKGDVYMLYLHSFFLFIDLTKGRLGY